MASAFLTAACALFYNDEDSWKVCCHLQVIGDETASPMACRTILEWVGNEWFDGRGKADDWVGWDRWSRQQIALGFEHFSAVDPEAQARDYLASLGMAC